MLHIPLISRPVIAQEIVCMIDEGGEQVETRGGKVGTILRIYLGLEKPRKQVVAIQMDGCGGGREQRRIIVVVIETQTRPHPVAAESGVDGHRLEGMLEVFHVVGADAFVVDVDVVAAERVGQRGRSDAVGDKSVLSRELDTFAQPQMGVEFCR